MNAGRAAAFCLACMLGACRTDSSPPPTNGLSDADLIGAAKQAVLASLKDPSSAQFIGTLTRRATTNSFGQSMEIVCGRVNSKNSFGAFTGAKLFVYKTDDRRVYLDGEGDQIERQAAAAWCAS